MNLDSLNVLNEDAAMRALLECCGSTRWARQMSAERPFASTDAIADAADRIWASLDPADWLEAFGTHPKIGSGGTGGSGGSGGTGGSDAVRWSADEQAGVRSAATEVRDRLAAGNREYEARFGYIFIVCATGKSAGEMLAMLERRLHNDPAVELMIAGEEQRRITRLRLDKLLAGRMSTA